MSTLSTLGAIDLATASLWAELRAVAHSTPDKSKVILLRDVPLQYRAALQRQGANNLIDVDGEPALRLEHVEAWITNVRRTFHQADSAETIRPVTWLRRFNMAGINDHALDKREVTFAEKNAQERGFGPMMTLVAQRLNLPILPEQPSKAAATAADQMVDLSKVLSASDYAQVDPVVRTFYANPTSWTGDITLGFDGTQNHGLMCSVLTKVAAEAVTFSGASLVGDRMPTSGTFPFETELYKDAHGDTHWNRYVVDTDGRRKPLFIAGFTTKDGQIRETFTAAGMVDIPLYFNVTPYQGGVRLTLDPSHSSKLFTSFVDIEFTGTPSGDGGVDVHGRVAYKQLGRAAATVAARMYPMAAIADNNEVQLKSA